jgi:hypothetical protein
MIYGIGLAVVTYTSRTTISDVTHDTKQRWQQSHSVANGNVDPKKSKRSSSETSSSQDSFFTPTFPNRQYPTPTYQSQPTPDGLHRPDTPSSIYSTSTYTSIRRGPHDNVEQGMLYQPGPVYPSSRSIASVESSGEVEQGTSLSAIPSRVRYDYSRKSARTPSPAPSVSSHGSSSSLLPGRPPRTLSPPVQGYDFRSRSPQRPMQPFHPERMIGPYPSVFNSPPPRGQEYGMATQLSQVPPFHHRQRLRPTGQLPANVRTVPLALRHARGNVNGRYAPSDSDHSFESSLRSPSASVRSPPSTPIPQDVSEADDIPVITPYGGIADEPHFLGLPSGPKAQRGQNTGYARHD